MSSPTKKTQNYSTMSPPKDTLSLSEYEEKKRKQLEKLKKRNSEDKKLFKEMTKPNETEVLTKSRDMNLNNPLATKEAQKYEKTRERLLQKYMMK